MTTTLTTVLYLFIKIFRNSVIWYLNSSSLWLCIAIAPFKNTGPYHLYIALPLALLTSLLSYKFIKSVYCIHLTFSNLSCSFYVALLSCMSFLHVCCDTIAYAPSSESTHVVFFFICKLFVYFYWILARILKQWKSVKHIFLHLHKKIQLNDLLLALFMYATVTNL